MTLDSKAEGWEAATPELFPQFPTVLGSPTQERARAGLAQAPPQAYRSGLCCQSRWGLGCRMREISQRICKAADGFGAHGPPVPTCLSGP